MLFAGVDAGADDAVGEADVAGEAVVGGEAVGGFCAPARSGNMTAMENVRYLLIAATFFRFDTFLTLYCSPR
jgi:hypothetical protein